MLIGLDLDNTIICYDKLFARIAFEFGWISQAEDLPKSRVKAEVMERFGNDTWTELQAHVYGPAIAGAEPFPGVESAVRAWRAAGHDLVVISHKTRFPALGPQCDLREAALAWLEARKWFAADMLGMEQAAVEFHDSRSSKVAAISRRGCHFFVDDLPEVFAECGFPHLTQRILFDPAYAHTDLPGATICHSWSDIDFLIQSNPV